MEVKVKALNLLLYTICVIILPTRGDVQENESQLSESNYNKLESTVQPLPLALQMVTTTEQTKGIEDSVAQVEMVDATVEQSKPETVTLEANESQQETNADNAEKSSEVVNEPNLAGTEQKQQEVEDETIKNTGGEEREHEVGEAENLAQNVEQNKPQGAATEENPQDKKPDQASVEEVAPDNENADTVPTEVEEVEQTDSKPVIAVVDGEQNSIDYPADAPAMNGDKEVEDEGKLPKPVEVNGEHSDASVEHQTTNDLSNSETTDADKVEESVVNVEQHAYNGAEIVVTDKPADMSGVGEATRRPNRPMMHNTDSAINSVSITPSLLDQTLTCYSCISTMDAQCSTGPGKLINCQARENKPNGCYTLYKADTNITTRGCITELAEAGLKYCQSNVKHCIMCYEKNCNNLLAPSAAVKISFMLNLWLGFSSFLCLKFFL